MIDLTKPNPGSDEAIKAGCTCPVIDNGYGRGYYGGDNFVISMNCPLHTIEVEELQKMIGIDNERN